MDGPQTDDQIASRNRNDFSPREKPGEPRKRGSMRIRGEVGDPGDPVRKVKIRVAGRAAPAVLDDGWRHRETDDLEPLAHGARTA